GQRVLVDVKHMSELARKEFYAYRNTMHPAVPIIYSHGACQKYYKFEINLSENDIVEIAKSNGIIGLEIDQRILGYNEAGNRFKKWVKNIFKKDSKQKLGWAEVYWANLLCIAETCYLAGFKDDPWKFISIGSDFDGVINPLNEFRTIDKLDDLINSLQEHLRNYWQGPSPVIPANCGGAPSDVMYNVGYKNLICFTDAYFR
ncbi:MAG: hypothetical protein EOO04_39660, partial [Chitinophagaceae bacterium]